MPAKNLSSYLKEKDRLGVEVGSWALSDKPGFAKCRYCSSTHNFGKGVGPLLSHSISKKHRDRIPSSNNAAQLTLEESFSDNLSTKTAQAEKDKNVKEFTLDLVRSLSRHRIPFEYMDCLSDILKKHLSDEIVQDMKVHHTKAAYITKYAISETYQRETVRLLRGCDAFTLGFDETEINKTSELELLAKISHPKVGIQLRHYKTLDLENGTAETITKTILDALEGDLIDYRKTMIGAMNDGCNTMEGHISGVKKRLSNVIPQFGDMGSCNSHHLGNAFEYGVMRFDNDSKEALVNIFFDLGGAKGKGVKRKKEFEKNAQSMGITPIEFKKVCTTRFRSYRLALYPVLKNWHAVVSYYSKIKPSSERQENLKKYFVEQEFMSKLKLNFLWAASKDSMEGLDYFEERGKEIYNVHKKMDEILSCNIKKHQASHVVETLDDDGNLIKRHVHEILEADVSCEKTQLSKKKVFIGSKCTEMIKKLGLSPNSIQLAWFYEKVYAYHTTVSQFMQKYFKKGLLDTKLKYMAGLSPRNREDPATPIMLKFLSKSFSKVAESIQPIDGEDALVGEIEKYSVDSDLLCVDNSLPFLEYWTAVGKVTEGQEWLKYDVLPRFALSMGAFFISNSEVERAFSVETDIHRDPKKNRMSQMMLDAHMNIRYGVESELSYNKKECSKCNSKRKRPHCHCSKAEINEEMLSLYNEAYKMTEGEEREKVEIAEESVEVLEARENSRLESLKEKLMKRNSFYDEHTMMPVYEQEPKVATSSKKKAIKDNQTKVSTESAEKDMREHNKSTTVVNQKNLGFRIPKRNEAKGGSGSVVPRKKKKV